MSAKKPVTDPWKAKPGRVLKRAKQTGWNWLRFGPKGWTRARRSPKASSIKIEVTGRTTGYLYLEPGDIYAAAVIKALPKKMLLDLVKTIDEKSKPKPRGRKR